MVAEADKIALNQTQAARALGVTDRTLRNWRESGLLVPVKRGGVVLYPVELLKNFVNPAEPAGK